MELHPWELSVLSPTVFCLIMFCPYRVENTLQPFKRALRVDTDREAAYCPLSARGGISSHTHNHAFVATESQQLKLETTLVGPLASHRIPPKCGASSMIRCGKLPAGSFVALGRVPGMAVCIESTRRQPAAREYLELIPYMFSRGKGATMKGGGIAKA